MDANQRGIQDAQQNKGMPNAFASSAEKEQYLAGRKAVEQQTQSNQDKK